MTNTETDILTVAALRFDGYKYLEQKTRRDSGFDGDFSPLTVPVVESMILHTDVLDNMAAFFALQRYLNKWGGEMLSLHSKNHLAYRFLFLHTYTLDVPEEYRQEEYWLRWQREYVPNLEEHAAVIRKTFRRRGRPPKKITFGPDVAG